MNGRKACKKPGSPEWPSGRCECQFKGARSVAGKGVEEGECKRSGSCRTSRG